MVTVSGQPNRSGFAHVYEGVEYGTVTYKDIVVDVIAPIAGLHEHWRYIGYPKQLLPSFTN